MKWFGVNIRKLLIAQLEVIFDSHEKENNFKLANENKDKKINTFMHFYDSLVNVY